jgi:hypothetical protein
MRVGLLKPVGMLCLAGLVCSLTPAWAQAPAKPAVKGDVSDEYPDLVELDPFGGVSLFGQINRGLGEKLINGGTGGGRVTVNVSRYVGLELGYNFMGNNVRLPVPIAPGVPTFNFADQSHYLALNPVFNLRPRGSRIQPYLTAGVGALEFVPTLQARNFALAPATYAIYGSQNLKKDLEVALNYGGGIKVHISPRFGLRFDARALMSKNPTFGLPSFSNTQIYIPGKQRLNGLELTVGAVFYLGRHVVPAPPAPPTPPPTPLNAGEITGAGGTLCQGKPITLHATATDPQGHSLAYAWKLNGQPTGGNGPDFTFTPNNAGDNTVEVSVSDATDATRKVTAGPKTVTVQDYTPPQIAGVSATPSSLRCAADTTGIHTAALAGQATGSACGGSLTYKWAVTEGSVTNDSSPNATFDASNLNFESGGQSQTKTITATLTATDVTGKSASQSTTITVDCPPQYKRLPDVVFAKNNARVNNCGKRVLIDQAAQQAGTAYNILLVAHRSGDEKAILIPARKGRNAAPARTLDEQRALNAAAVLTGDHGTCATVDVLQVMMDAEGTDQSSTPDPGICGTSTLAATKERRGSKVSDADKERRVEVYLVPKGSKVMPPAAKNAKPVPESVVKALGCPK